MNRRAFLTAAAAIPLLAAGRRVLAAPPTGVLHAFGDSITVGVGAYSNHGYASIVASQLGRSLDNRAISSTLVADAKVPAYGLSVDIDSVSTWLTGFNDYCYFGSSPLGFATYRGGLEAIAAWLAIPEDRKVRAAAADAQGHWVRGGLSAESRGLGDSLSFEVSGNVIYVAASAIGDSGGGIFGVTVDGKPAAVGHCFGAALGPNKPASAPFLVRVAGLRPGRHRVDVTVQSSFGAVMIDWCAGNDARGPSLYLSGPLHCADYSNPNAPGFGNGSAALADAYRAEANRVAKMLRGDGLDVVAVDADRYFQPESGDTDPPDVHPNDRGHEHVARAFIEAMT